MEADQENVREAELVKEVHVITGQSVDITILQQMWVDYRALNGIIIDTTNPDENLRKMTIQEFADSIGVTPPTLYRWQSDIPDFWARVNKRRQELSGQTRLAKMHNVWFTSAMKKGNEGYRDRVLWLANFDPNFRMPAQKVEHEAGNSWTAIAAAVQKKRSQEPVEGEIVDGTATP